MAQKIQTLLIDDLDGDPATETVRFGLDRVEYEIDLNAGHAQDLRAVIGKYVRHARKVAGRARRPRTPDRAGNAASDTEIRNWAREQGHDIKDRGRVPADIRARYTAAAAAAR